VPAPAVVAPAAEEKKIVASVDKKPADRRPKGKIEVDINPWGAVSIDGVKRGVSPPLKTIDLPPGKHTVVVRNASFPPHVEQVVVKSGEVTKIRHRFR
jgi:hypothetical protein